ncbi:hypothetical protein HYH03_016276 [Edaphochlamys debaryana]|uniref:Serine-threonine/tyrosine-protein kinase catalytic domain-containing protein n=1 Tax=Edaphochlamys debaryana TaxID=47281 RepID=A0A835XHX0_9CHLO|nr:hypothetical protein HYH03_016276 [Edaphochlamys debaryana]|eukprot:KAG2484982.1 hypothetical protein HYH03_016276 [Edaphochlamys debaryana]
MMTGKRPYENLMHGQILLGVSLQGLRPKLPDDQWPELCALARRCMEQDPEERPSFADLEDAMVELEEALRLTPGDSQRGSAEPLRPVDPHASAGRATGGTACAAGSAPLSHGQQRPYSLSGPGGCGPFQGPTTARLLGYRPGGSRGSGGPAGSDRRRQTGSTGTMHPPHTPSTRSRSPRSGSDNPLQHVPNPLWNQPSPPLASYASLVSGPVPRIPRTGTAGAAAAPQEEAAGLRSLRVPAAAGLDGPCSDSRSGSASAFLLAAEPAEAAAPASQLALTTLSPWLTDEVAAGAAMQLNEDLT